jgi:hypothetical protein
MTAASTQELAHDPHHMVHEADFQAHAKPPKVGLHRWQQALTWSHTHVPNVHARIEIGSTLSL